MSRCLRGFMLAYCQELTGVATGSLRKLLAATLDDSPRAAEPLMLLAIAQGRGRFLLSLAKDTPLEDRYANFLDVYESSGLDAEEFALSLEPTNRFGKAAASWKSELQQLDRDRKTLMGVAAKMAQLLEDKGITRAEACRILGLDKGNFYAFLKGNPAKLSRKTAMEAYRKLAAY